MKYLIILALCVVGLLTGCKATKSRNVFNVEFAAASTADAFMQGYAKYWKKATNCPVCYNTDIGFLIQQRNQLSLMSEKVGASVLVVENLRAASQTNNVLEPILNTAITSLDNITSTLVNSVTNTLSR